MTVTVRDQTLIARADAEGSWQVTPTPLAVGPVTSGSTDVAGEIVMAAPDPLGITITPSSSGSTHRWTAPRPTSDDPSSADPVSRRRRDPDRARRRAAGREVGDDGRWSVPLADDLDVGPTSSGRASPVGGQLRHRDQPVLGGRIDATTTPYRRHRRHGHAPTPATTAAPPHAPTQRPRHGAADRRSPTSTGSGVCPGPPRGAAATVFAPDGPALTPRSRPRPLRTRPGRAPRARPGPARAPDRRSSGGGRARRGRLPATAVQPGRRDLRTLGG